MALPGVPHLRRRIQAAARAVEGPEAGDWGAFYFLPAPSCPPDTRVHVRGGRLWQVWDGVPWLIPSGAADLADPAGSGVWGATTSPLYSPSEHYIISFDTAGYYRVYTLVVKVPADAGMEFYLVDLEAEAEFATAAEAEAAWPGTASWDTEAWYQGFPVCGLVLRNDGRAGTPGAILDIDRVNRGRSYIWPPDCRPLDYLA
jgi:hypothetical protein